MYDCKRVSDEIKDGRIIVKLSLNMIIRTNMIRWAIECVVIVNSVGFVNKRFTRNSEFSIQ